jgi:hypothetical protein
MKFVIYASYVDNPEAVNDLRPKHHEQNVHSNVSTNSRYSVWRLCGPV